MIEGPLAKHLAVSFQEMFARSTFQHKRFARLHKSGARKMVLAPEEQLLLSGPGRGRNPIKSALLHDLAHARSVQIMVGYFLPTWRLRHQLVRIARSGGQVQLILGAKSDVTLALLAARSLYRRLLKGNVQIYEYQPQVLHAKLFIVDDVVYVGSANLDQRSLHINYELMVRFESHTVTAQAREFFSKALKHCHQIGLEEWRGSRTLWSRLKQRWAYWLLVRIDPYVARWQWRALPDKPPAILPGPPGSVGRG
jgi:cardiolipin synthase